MVDIHCHILFGVDDGAKSIEISSAMLDDAKEQGITDIIATPHYRVGMFDFLPEKVMKSYGEVSRLAAQKGLRLYLGCEYHVDGDILHNLRNGRVVSLAGSDYVLTEFSSRHSFIQVRNRIEEIITGGYIPVVAHAERNGIIQKDPDLLMQFREMGALIQLNADSVLGYDGRGIKKASKAILKKNLVDIIASDSHDMEDRRNCMLECRKYIERKYGVAKAQKLFDKNPGKIIPPPQAREEVLQEQYHIEIQPDQYPEQQYQEGFSQDQYPENHYPEDQYQQEMQSGQYPEENFSSEENFQSEQSEESFQSEESYQSEENYQSEESFQSEENYQSEEGFQSEERYQSEENFQSEESFPTEENFPTDESFPTDENFPSDENFQSEGNFLSEEGYMIVQNYSPEGQYQEGQYPQEDQYRVDIPPEFYSEM